MQVKFNEMPSELLRPLFDLESCRKYVWEWTRWNEFLEWKESEHRVQLVEIECLFQKLEPEKDWWNWRIWRKKIESYQIESSWDLKITGNFD